MTLNESIFDVNNLIVATKKCTLEDCKRAANPYANQITWTGDMQLPMLLPSEFRAGDVFEFALLNKDKTKYIFLSQLEDADRQIHNVHENEDKFMSFKRFLRICPFHAPKEFTKSHKKNGIKFEELSDINSRLVRDQLSDINLQLFLILRKKEQALKKHQANEYLNF